MDTTREPRIKEAVARAMNRFTPDEQALIWAWADREGLGHLKFAQIVKTAVMQRAAPAADVEAR